MDGSATFTMVMSRTIISIPVHSTPRATQRDRLSMAVPLLDLSAHQYVEPEGPDFDTDPRILFCRLYSWTGRGAETQRRDGRPTAAAAGRTRWSRPRRRPLPPRASRPGRTPRPRPGCCG